MTDDKTVSKVTSLLPSNRATDRLMYQVPSTPWSRVEGDRRSPDLSEGEEYKPGQFKPFIGSTPTESNMIEDQQENGHRKAAIKELIRKLPYDLKDCVVHKDDPTYSKPLTIPGGISFSPTDDMVRVLDSLATAQGINPTEALRKAIATEQYLYEQRQKGATILLLTADKEVREVVFR